MLKIKTLIELFDAVQIENVVAGLRFRPEKIVFIGFEQIMTKRKIKSLREFFSAREENIELDFKFVGRYDFDEIVKTLSETVTENDGCCLDLTGGQELVVAAMGEVSAIHDIPMFQFNVRTGTFIKVKNCENIAETKKSCLSLEECVKLNGCCITHNEKDDYEWKLSGDFRRDIQTMWDICREHCAAWNYQSVFFENMEKKYPPDEDLRITVDLQREKDIRINTKIVNALIKNRLISDYEKSGDILTFRYKNEQVHRCITKAGNILELYVYMLLREIAEEEPGYYDDTDIGIYIDWDGVVHVDGEALDVKNEIDIMVMRDLVPIFISCKNGEVHKEALYELSVAADRFGGRYAKKFLLTTYVNANNLSGKYVLARAREMGIEPIDGLHKLTRQEFKNLLRKRIK